MTSAVARTRAGTAWLIHHIAAAMDIENPHPRIPANGNTSRRNVQGQGHPRSLGEGHRCNLTRKMVDNTGIRGSIPRAEAEFSPPRTNEILSSSNYEPTTASRIRKDLGGRHISGSRATTLHRERTPLTDSVPSAAWNFHPAPSDLRKAEFVFHNDIQGRRKSASVCPGRRSVYETLTGYGPRAPANIRRKPVPRLSEGAARQRDQQADKHRRRCSLSGEDGTLLKRPVTPQHRNRPVRQFPFCRLEPKTATLKSDFCRAPLRQRTLSLAQQLRKAGEGSEQED